MPNRYSNILDFYNYHKIKCNQTRVTTFIKTRFNISDDQTNIDKYRLAANITEYHIKINLTTNHYCKLLWSSE